MRRFHIPNKNRSYDDALHAFPLAIRKSDRALLEYDAERLNGKTCINLKDKQSKII